MRYKRNNRQYIRQFVNRNNRGGLWKFDIKEKTFSKYKIFDNPDSDKKMSTVNHSIDQGTEYSGWFRITR